MAGKNDKVPFGITLKTVVLARLLVDIEMTMMLGEIVTASEETMCDDLPLLNCEFQTF